MGQNPRTPHGKHKINILKKLLWALLGLLLVAPIVALLAGVKLDQFKKMSAPEAQPPVLPETVTSYEIREEQWQPRISSVGSVLPVRGTVVSTEAEGTVRQVTFTAGSAVTTGSLLLQLDIDIEQAQLQEAAAAADLAKVSYGRAKELVEGRSISKAEYDTAAANLKQALSRTDNIQALIAKKTLRAPFAGKLGINRISVGQFLQKGSEVVSLQALDPVYVVFSLPQQQLAEAAEGLKVVVKTDSYPNQSFNGIITAINPSIDLTTRNVQVQATLPNKDEKLRPGMFAAVDLISSQTETVIFVPATAVQHAPFGDSVFIIDKNQNSSDTTTAALVLRQQIVRLGARQGDFVMVTDGLKPGDIVVSTGVFKYRAGIGVEIDNKLAPEFKLNPTPDNT